MVLKYVPAGGGIEWTHQIQVEFQVVINEVILCKTLNQSLESEPCTWTAVFQLSEPPVVAIWKVFMEKR